MMMMSFGAIGVVGVIYILWGYSMSFGNLQDGTTDIAGLFANPFDLFGLGELIGDGQPALIDVFGVGVFIPEIIFAGFQLTFAVITVALISGAVADRVKFSTWLVFAGIWATLVYFPIAHMVWGGGLLSGAESGLSAKIFGVDRRGRPRAAHRLRRWHGRAHQRRYRRPRPRPRRRQAPRLRQDRHASAQRARSSCSAPVCCGSAGSASTPAPSSLPTAWPRVVWLNTTAATVRRHPRLARRGEAP